MTRSRQSRADRARELESAWMSDTRGHEPFCTDHDHRAETITDEQIRDLARGSDLDGDVDRAHIPELAMAALSPVASPRRARSRAICADIWNTRTREKL